MDPHDEFKAVMSPVFAHTSWSRRDGAPQNISAIAQSTDGFLWLGTPFGLYRFDGTEFARYPTTSLGSPLPSIDIETLTADTASGVWIGFRSGGISHLSSDGTLQNYNPENHRGPNSAQKFIIRQDGSVWAIGDYRLYKLAGNHWENIGPALSLSNDPLLFLYVDRAGRMWTSTRHALFELKPSAKTFALFPTTSFMIVDMAETPDGALWISDAWHQVRPLVPSDRHPGWKISGYVRMLSDAAGSLWLAQDYHGVSHMPWQKVQGALTTETDLSSEQTNVIFKDREGEIWVGTSRGLDRFRSSPLTQLSNIQVEYYPSLCVDATHGVWLGTLAHPIAYASHGKLLPTGHAVGSSPLLCDDRGAVWMVDPIHNQLTRWANSAMTRFPLPEEVHDASALSIGLDWDGALLVSFKPNGLWRFDGAWSRVNDSELSRDEPLAIVRDKQKRVWLGFANDDIVERDPTGNHVFGRQKSGGLGNVLTFSDANKRIWAGGTNGLAYLDGDTFRRVGLARDHSLTGISGIAEDKYGNLWLNTSLGIIRIGNDQLADLVHTGSHLDYEVFDDRDGVTGTAAQLKPTPSAVADKDGPLWFSTSGQVISINPESVIPRPQPPSVIIEQVLVNGSPLTDREHPIPTTSLQSGHLKELEIAYVGIDLGAPEKIVYRYMLEGEDKTWHEVGPRRLAFYTKLSPGKYRFRLSAANGTGKWTELSTPLLIAVTPAFYQTPWFRSALAILSLGVLYCAYLLRVRSLTSSLRRRMSVRADERMRIARDLHDTLLQSIHGLMLRFHFATEELPLDEPARQPLLLALERADGVYIEARRRIDFLRDEVPEEPDFALQLTKIAEELDLRSSSQFRIVEEGQRRFLTAEVRSELCKIARESLLNTVQHGKAKSVEVCIFYNDSEVIMRCSDNGTGIPTQIMHEGRRSGHWGLVGMKERASAIDGKFQVWSSVGEGTQIEVRVPGSRAYNLPVSKTRWLDQLRQLQRSSMDEDGEM